MGVENQVIVGGVFQLIAVTYVQFIFSEHRIYVLWSLYIIYMITCTCNHIMIQSHMDHDNPCCYTHTTLSFVLQIYIPFFFNSLKK